MAEHLLPLDTRYQQRGLLRRRYGWIGADIGSKAIKLAQVRRSRSAWKLVAGLVIPAPEQGQLASRETIAAVIRDGLARCVDFKGRNAACTLSMSGMDLQTLDLPSGSEAEIEMMVSQELEGEATGPQEFGYWRNPRAKHAKDHKIQVNVVSLPRTTATDVADGLSAAGLNCRVLDGLPFCLARAVSMAQQSKDFGATAAIDWGARSATITLAVNGGPVFARRLRDCAVGDLVASVANGLGLSDTESCQLITRFGLAPVRGERTSSDIQQALVDFAKEPLQRFRDEAERTLSFLRQHYQELFPTKIWLFGGGAAIPNIANWIESEIGIETSVWRLSDDPENHADAQIGPAIALSGLSEGML